MVDESKPDPRNDAVTPAPRSERGGAGGTLECPACRSEASVHPAGTAGRCNLFASLAFQCARCPFRK
jgi:hypothetical protein